MGEGDGCGEDSEQCAGPSDGNDNGDGNGNGHAAGGDDSERAGGCWPQWRLGCWFSTGLNRSWPVEISDIIFEDRN
jgi:hypothetical protein